MTGSRAITLIAPGESASDTAGEPTPLRSHGTNAPLNTLPFRERSDRVRRSARQRLTRPSGRPSEFVISRPPSGVAMTLSVTPSHANFCLCWFALKTIAG